MQKRFLKLAILLLIFSLTKVGLTNAFLVDQENSNNNLFVAGSLDFSLRDTNNTTLSSFFNLNELKPQEPQIKVLRIKKEGSLDFKYEAQFVKTGGDDDFCQALKLETKLGETIKYQGQITNFVLVPALLIGSSGQDEWQFTLSLDNTDSSLQNKTCQFNFVFKGWQIESDGKWGYVDEEVLTNSVSTHSWITPTPTVLPTPIPTTPTPTPSIPAGVVINEVYYDVDNSHGTEDKNEWVELYNNSDTGVSLKDWKLVDGLGNSRVINENVTLPPHSFAVLSHDNSTWTQYWSVPSGTIKINWGGNAWLNNDGDKLILKDNSGNERDMVAWENYVSGWNLNASEGKSIARKVKGVDTDLPSDWEVLDVPNPGTNPHSSEVEPVINFVLRSDKKAVSFKVDNLKKYKTLYYEILYEANGLEKGISSGSAIDLKNEDSFERNNLILGSCSGIEGKVCTYDTGITDLTLRVVLALPNGQTTEIIRKIAY